VRRSASGVAPSGVRRHALATLGAVIVALWLGGCASMAPEPGGGHAAAAIPPPVSVRCSVRF